MHDEVSAPDSTAVRVALWRALHSQIDPAPHVFEDEVGLRLVAPDESWRRRPDMDSNFTKPFRASIVARARFIEDLVFEQVERGVGQYVILGAGLDTFAQRRPEMGSRLKVSRSIGRVRKLGSESAWSSLALESQIGCDLCQWTSRRAHGGSN
jgi:O-methyltransferase involved in polyketide biosynthesis